MVVNKAEKPARLGRCFAVNSSLWTLFTTCRAKEGPRVQPLWLSEAQICQVWVGWAGLGWAWLWWSGNKTRAKA